MQSPALHVTQPTPKDVARHLQAALESVQQVTVGLSTLDEAVHRTALDRLAELIPRFAELLPVVQEMEGEEREACRKIAREIRAQLACNVLLADFSSRMFRRLFPELVSELSWYAPQKNLSLPRLQAG